MTLDTLFTICGILVAVLAIMRPVQRHSILLFVPLLWMALALIASFVLIVCRDTPFGVEPPFGWPLEKVVFFKTCIEAENGKEAIDVAKQNKPDVTVLDLSMPVMNGLQSAPELRKVLPQTPIILFTLYGQSLSQTEASKSGISLVLEKTVPLSTLIEKAHQLMAE